MDNTLMHMCCAPCANQPIAQLREEGLSVTGFWFNPNIHPYTEYQARKRTLEDYAREIGMKLVIGGTYDLRPFVTAVAGNIDGRCPYCYRVRMEETARYAAIRTMMPSPPLPVRWGRSTGWTSCTGISGHCFRRVRPLPGSTASICRNIAAASSVRRTAIWRPSGRKRSRLEDCEPLYK